MSGLSLKMPPGMGRRLRLSDDLSQRRRQWVYVWLGAVFTPLLALVTLLSLSQDGFGLSTAAWLVTAAVVLGLSVKGTLARNDRSTLPLLGAFVVGISILGERNDPASFGPVGGFATAIGLISLTESAINILATGAVTMVACAVPLVLEDAHLHPGSDIPSRLGTLFVITTLAYVGSRSSSRVLDDLRDNISDNEAMAAILTESLANLEATVDERTQSLAARTAELEGINADLDAAIAEQSMLAERLRRQSLHDELTGLVNRRGFIQALSTPEPGAGWIVMADLDHFKTINDTWGHPAGDEALAHFAGVLARLAPPDALAARVGGEEFALVLPQRDRADVEALLQRLLHEVRALVIPNLRGHRITVSLGAAQVHPRPPQQTTQEYRRLCMETLRRADRALYEAKESGRDRSVLLGTPSPV